MKNFEKTIGAKMKQLTRKQKPPLKGFSFSFSCIKYSSAVKIYTKTSLLLHWFYTKKSCILRAVIPIFCVFINITLLIIPCWKIIILSQLSILINFLCALLKSDESFSFTCSEHSYILKFKFARLQQLYSIIYLLFECHSRV